MLLTINISRLLFASKPLKYRHSLRLSKLQCHTCVYWSAAREMEKLSERKSQGELLTSVC